MITGKDMFNQLKEASGSIQPLFGSEFAVIHPETFPEIKQNLESEGVKFTPPDDSTGLWIGTHDEYNMVVLKIAVSNLIEKDKVLVMPLADFEATLNAMLLASLLDTWLQQGTETKSDLSGTQPEQTQPGTESS